MKVRDITIVGVGLMIALTCQASFSADLPKTMNPANDSRPMTRSTSSLSAQDKTYLDQIAQTNLGEIKILSVVEKKAQWPASRQLAAHYAKDHMIAERKLQMLAAKFNYKLPADVSLTQKASTLYLSMQPKSHFDTQYRTDMINGHRDAISNTQKELTQGSNSQVKAYAMNMLSDLKMHLLMARNLPTGSTMKQASK